MAYRPQARLKPWAKVTGQVLWSGKPGSDTPVLLSAERFPGSTPVTVAQYEHVTADTDGRFVFEKALPGMIQVSCPLKTAPEAPWPLDIVLTGRRTLVKAESGSNTLLVGGRGRTVKGLLRGMDLWEGVTFSIALQDPPEGTPDNETRRQVFENFRNSPEGAPFFRDGLKPSADGSFEIPGMLPGTYRIFATIPGGDGTLVNAGTLIRIDQESPNEPPAPVDIGELVLTTAPVFKP
ncbi:MAG: hypothetical protein EOP86_26930 [Verrucomicrobiaceae bacterium]|nr:MAG: hypothetical protein EOP86_26930 [Verrucomicrobiaceae bacterium]